MRFYPPYPKYIKKGKGSRIWDVEGKEYTDFLLAYGPLILGHSHPDITKEVLKTVRAGSLFGAPIEAEVRFGEILKKSSGMERLRFVNTGTEATLQAIRLAMYYTKRKKILKIDGSYHGTHPFNFPSDLVEAVNFNSTAEITSKLKSREFAGIIIEPVLGNIGVIPPGEGYLEEVREISEKYGSLLIMDEVITGYRTGFLPYYKTKRIEPDLASFAKIVGGGYPLGLYGGREDILKNVKPEGQFPQAGTFSGNPVSVAAGLAALRVLSKKNYEALRNLTSSAVKILSESGLTVNSQTGMLSLFFTEKRVESASDARGTNKELYPEFFRAAMRRGIYLAPSYDESIFISFVHGERDVRESFASLAEVARGLWKRR